MKKLLILILSLSMLLAIFAGCAKKEEEGDEGYVPADTVPYEEAYELPLTNFEGEGFEILSPAGKIWQFQTYHSNTDAINNALVERNMLIEEKFNCTIEMVYVAHNAEAMSTAVSQEALSGFGEYDLVFSDRGWLPTTYGYYYNQRELPEIAFDQTFMAPGYNSTLAIGGVQYNSTGYAALSYVEGAVCVTFNRTLYNQLFDVAAQGTIYDLIDNGQWTFENMKALAKIATYDHGEDGMEYGSEDRFGIMLSRSGGMAFLAGMGAKYMPLDDQGTPYYNYLDDNNIAIFDLVYNLMGEKGVFFKDNYQALADSLCNNEALFVVHSLSTAKMIRLNDPDIDWGFAPMPLRTAEQTEYRTFHEGSTEFYIMSTVKDIAKNATIYNALCYYSYLYVKPAQVDTSLKLQTAQDPDSSRILGIVLDSVALEFSYIYNTELGGYTTYVFTLCVEQKYEYSSFYQGQQEGVEARLRELISSYSNPTGE